jgi:Protein of unknown function (DUF2526).
MSHLNEVIARVDAAIEECVITHMNELLIVLSEDAELSREDRYTQQQRLRTMKRCKWEIFRKCCTLTTFFVLRSISMQKCPHLVH